MCKSQSKQKLFFKDRTSTEDNTPLLCCGVDLF
jgi:hypothetical protein